MQACPQKLSRTALVPDSQSSRHRCVRLTLSQALPDRHAERPAAKHARKGTHTPAALATPEALVAAEPATVAPESVEALERALQLPAEDVSSSSSTSRVLGESGDSLKSNWTHRAIVGGGVAAQAAILASGLLDLHSLGAGVAAAVALAAGYLLADLGSGVAHWGLDNYGDKATPAFGDAIHAFQGHHQWPRTITYREPANNLHKVFKPFVPISLAYLAISGYTPAALDVFMGSFLFLVCMSQQFHAWSHMKKSELPAVVDRLQESGILISRKAHGAHHRAPFEGNYCIVSGIWNEFLDDSGSDKGFFRRLERFVAATTGVEPRCWQEPTYELYEQQSAGYQ